jgi:hypothetical protein
MYLVVFWWVVVFSYSHLETWLFVNFAHLILYSVLLYLQAVLIIPSNLEPGTDLEAHFFSVRPWFFFIGVLIPLMELTDSLMHGLSNLLGFGPVYILMQSSGIVLSAVAMRTANRTFHAVICLGYLGSMVAWTATRFWSIS